MLRFLSLPVAECELVATMMEGCSETSAPPPGLARAALQAGAATPTLTPQQSGTRNRLQAVSPVNEQVVWASGVGGTYTVTTDGGQSWRAAVVPGAETLQFRDV